MTVTGAGRVGIGITTPGAWLSIQADQDETEFLHLIGHDDDGPSQRPSLKLLRSRGSIGSPKVIQSGDFLGGIVAAGYDGDNYQIPASIEFGTEGDISNLPEMPGIIEFHTAPPGSVQRRSVMKLNSIGWLSVAGSDFALGTNSGREIGEKTRQRALVHFENDQLWLNFDNDFEGGTKIGSPVEIFGNSVVRPSISDMGLTRGNGLVLTAYDGSGNTGLEIRSDQASSFLDFADDRDTDFDIRLRLSGDDDLVVNGGNLIVEEGTVTALNISAGNVSAGKLEKGAGSFKIDHPLDPENKYLSHSFVESPDMMNVYNGNIVLDAEGGAWVLLPEWFEALNDNFRYQLTAIGAPSPNLYIEQQIKGNRFRIAGGTPEMTVSWQVTGIRKDPFALRNRIVVEEEKSTNEKGTYLYPNAYIEE